MNEGYEKILDKFIEIEREKVRAGSGDDMAYELQIQHYIDSERKLWIEFMRFFARELKYGK